MSRPLPVLPVLALLGAALFAGTAAPAAVLRVGAGGDFAAIQPAIDAAIAAPGDDEIRVARGTYPELLKIDTIGDPKPDRLLLTGGWEAPDFEERLPLAALTIVTAADTGRPLSIACAAGTVSVEGLTFRDGRVEVTPIARESRGGGIYVLAGDGDCRIFLRDNALLLNRVVAEPDDFQPTNGGGLAAYLGGTAELTVTGNLIRGNEVSAAVGNAEGGGAHLMVREGSRLNLLDNDFLDNRSIAEGAAFATTSGLWLGLYDSATAEASDNVIAGNRVGSETFVLTTGAFLGCTAGGNRLIARRNRIQGTESPAGGVQLFLGAQSGCELLASDSLVADGDGQSGLVIDTRLGASVLLSNFTVTGNGGEGISTYGSAGEDRIEIANSISFGNGEPDYLSGPTVERSNRRTDPLFVDAARSNYRLRLDSPARDTGDNSPAAGLGPLDLDRGARVRNGRVDVGAYEIDFDPDRGSCRLSGAPTTPAIPQFSPLCSCLRDEVLRATRCAGLGDDFLIDLRLPPLPPPGADVAGGVRLHPRGPGDGEFELTAELLVGDQVFPVQVSGGTGRIKGKDADVKLRFQQPDQPATLRTTLRVLFPGQIEPQESQLDVRVDVP